MFHYVVNYIANFFRRFFSQQTTSKSGAKDIKTEVWEFLTQKEPKLCAVATTSKSGQPQCAVMGYAVEDDLSLVLSTDHASRKRKNLRTNKKVAVVIGWTFSELNVQYEGIANLVDKKSTDYKLCEDKYMSAHPESLEFKDDPSTMYITVRPTWVRLSDYLVNPARIIETNIR